MKRSGSRSASACALLWILATLSTGCSEPPPPPASAPNLLLISLDALRADRLGAYGYARQTTPFLDQLARGGLRFENAFVNTHGTPPSHTTLLSSLYQESHRVSFEHRPDGWSQHRVPDELTMVQELLQEHGYRTLAVTDGGFMTPRLGFGQGFDHFDDEGEGIDSGRHRLLRMLRRHHRPERPSFVFFHTYEVHSPYEPPEGYQDLFGATAGLAATSANLLEYRHRARELIGADLQHLSAQYDRGLRYTDDVLAELFSELRQIGFLDNCLVIISSDHGEEFGEHGGLLHRLTLFEELLHVPLILSGPGVEEALVDHRLVSTIDIAPTLLAAAGLEAPSWMQGRNLLDLKHDPQRASGYVFSQYSGLLYSLRDRRFKLIESTRDGSRRLFDLYRDPHERRDASKTFPRRVERMHAALEAWRQAQPKLGEGLEQREVAMTEEERERLQALGYL